MANPHQAQFHGKTGKVYQFELYQDPPIFHRARLCTYMLLRRTTRSTDGSEGYQPIFIGETADFDKLLVNPESDRLLTSGDFDLIALREEADRITRLAQTLDLLQAFFPNESKSRFFDEIRIPADDWKKLNEYMH